MLKPLGDRVVVTFDKKEEETVGGFVLAGTQNNNTKIATIVAVGDGMRTFTGELVAPSVAVGDKVLVENGAGLDVKDGDKKVSVIHESDIIAIVK